MTSSFGPSGFILNESYISPGKLVFTTKKAGVRGVPGVGSAGACVPGNVVQRNQSLPKKIFCSIATHPPPMVKRSNKAENITQWSFL